MTTECKATLTIDGMAPVEFPIMTPTHGNDCVDIRTLGARTGLFTYDSGFLSTANCKSLITFIDGDAGQLLYRGYPIEQLAEQCNFLEVIYLLNNGELPNAAQKADFENTIRKHTMVHEQLARFYSGFRRDAHPMAVMTGVVGALSAFYHDAMDFSDVETRNRSFNTLIDKMQTIVTMAYKYNTGAPFMYPDNDLDYTANFMRMMFGSPCGKYNPNPVLVNTLDTIFPLHRRPRAERLDRDGASRRLLRRQPVRLHRRGYSGALGPVPWRRQRGGAENAGGNRRCFAHR